MRKVLLSLLLLAGGVVAVPTVYAAPPIPQAEAEADLQPVLMGQDGEFFARVWLVNVPKTFTINDVWFDVVAGPAHEKIEHETKPEAAIAGFKGTYTVQARFKITVKGKTQKYDLRKAVTIRQGSPPTPPNPPVPPNPPTPPAPTPDDPAPITEPGFRVIFVAETGDLDKYPRGQWNAMYAADVRKYINDKAVKDSDGDPAHYKWDQNTSTADQPEWFQKALKRPRASLPWVIVSNGKTGFEGPVPYNKDDPADITPILTLLKKYGG